MNILLIDDDIDCLDGLVTAIEPTGYRCDKFTVPEEAMEAYRQNQYDIVITDMRMPGMNGIEVLKHVRSIDPAAKVSIVTGFGDVNTAIAAVYNGAYAFFGKPVNLDDLIEIKKQKKLDVDYDRLALEYRRLKQAYEDLQKLLKDVGGKKPGYRLTVKPS